MCLVAWEEGPSFVLFTPQTVYDRVFNNIHLRERNDLILRDVLAKHTTLRKPDWQRSHLACGGGVVNQSVRAVTADPIESLSRFQVALGHRHNLAHRPTKGRHGGITMDRRPAKGRSNLEVRKVERRVKHVKRTLAKLVISELGLFERIIFVHDDESTRVRRRTQYIVNQSSFEHLIGRKQFGDFAHILARGTIHPATAGMKPSCVRQNS